MKSNSVGRFNTGLAAARLLPVAIVTAAIAACGGGTGGTANAPVATANASAGTGGSSGGSDGAGSSSGASSTSQLTPDAGAPPITAAAGTALHHAQMCAHYLGPIPEMSCADADIAPITVNGIEVSQEVDSCDRPNALSGACVPGERTSARYQGTHHDGSPRPEVTFVNFCRAGGMGVIGHNSETGATCFFQKREDTFPNDARHPGSDDPDSNYDQYWMTAQQVAEEHCTDCHQADPWLHSPWIDQLRDPNDPSQPLVPVLLSKSAPYVVIGDDFTQPYHDGAPENSCSSCHRPQCDDLFAVKLGELSMPGLFTDHNHFVGVTPDLEALRNWCGKIPTRGFQSGGHDDADDDDGDDSGGTCDAFFECSDSCASDDYACANACGSSHLSGSGLSSSQSLFSCLESYGCGLEDDSCGDQYCGPETDGLVNACGL